MGRVEYGEYRDSRGQSCVKVVVTQHAEQKGELEIARRRRLFLRRLLASLDCAESWKAQKYGRVCCSSVV